ncbi:MAG: hypothetical protein K9W44_08775 [Candidatus Lokiarchaeota archaeon]|nr:hypothetical protein [Candidatus Harpocratesius repetitus]
MESNLNNTKKEIENIGLKYVESQEHYLLFSILFPFYSIIVQIINILYTLELVRRPPPPPHPPLPLIDILTPFIIFLMISLFALLKFIYLLFLKKKVRKLHQYMIILKNLEKHEEFEEIENIPSLVKIFYDLINYVKTIRVIFIFVNLAFILYLQWSIRFILTYLHLIPPGPLPSNLIFHALNSIAEFGLLIYMVVEWHYFLRWNKKIKKLEDFERLIFDEIKYDNPSL